MMSTRPLPAACLIVVPQASPCLCQAASHLRGERAVASRGGAQGRAPAGPLEHVTPDVRLLASDRPFADQAAGEGEPLPTARDGRPHPLEHTELAVFDGAPTAEENEATAIGRP